MEKLLNLENMTPQAINDIFLIIKRLKQADSLYPDEQINALFSALVGLVQTHDAVRYENALAQFNLACLVADSQYLCGLGEYALELYWARKIREAWEPRSVLQQFPYLANYEKLVRLEVKSSNLTATKKKVLFIGSGPLPLSAFVLAEKYGMQVDCLDKSNEATTCGATLANVLGINQVYFINTAIEHYLDLASYQTIILGALVGTDSQEKERILEHLHTQIQPGTKVIVRSSHGLRELLYPGIEIHRLTYWHIENVIHPKDDLINSVIVLCKKF